MKQLFSLLFMTLVLTVTAQSETNSDEFSVAIFPGCEKLKVREDQFACFQKFLTNNYTSHLQKYMDSFEYLNIGEALAKVKFTIHTDGNMSLKQIESNNSIYKGYAELAFTNMVDELDAKKLKITPSKSLKNGQPIAVSSSFPVNFKLFEEVIESKDRVISILKDNNSTYEIILTPNQDIKVFEVGGVKPFYLGKYNSINELKETLPYKNLIQNEKELVTLAQSDFKEQKIILQTKNIFHQNSFYTIFIVSELKGKKIKQLRKYNSLKDFISSPYYSWITRN